MLLDISDNEEYVWIDLTNNKPIISAIIGSSVGVVLLLIGSFFLYKRYKKGQNKVLPTPENGKNDNSQETAQKWMKLYILCGETCSNKKIAEWQEIHVFFKYNC